MNIYNKLSIDAEESSKKATSTYQKEFWLSMVKYYNKLAIQYKKGLIN
jgi:hypothetical protein